MESGRDREARLLPIQLRVALAGIGNLNGPLTPSRVERLGGVVGLAAFYVERSTRGMQGAWPLLKALAQPKEAGGAKAVLLSDEDVAALVPGPDRQALLEQLVKKRIIRLRIDSSGLKMWQLYHDYLADAIIALDRRDRKWPLLVQEAAGRHRLANGLFEWWTRLLGPWTQLRLYWHRLIDRNFQFGEYRPFLRFSSLRLIFNLWVLSAVLASVGGIWENERRTARDLASAFFQNADEKQELRALWRLALLHSTGTSRAFFEELLSTKDGRARLQANIGPAITTLGLSTRSLNALRGLSAKEECFSIPTACASISLAAGDAAAFADSILTRIQQPTNPLELSALGNALAALAALAKEAHGEQAPPLADRILARMQQTTSSFELSVFGDALAALAKDMHGEKAAQLADRILARMQQTTSSFELNNLGNALAVLAKDTHGEQAALGADRILARMQQTTNPYQLYGLSNVLAALAKETHGEQAALGADRILAHVQQTEDSIWLSYLGKAWASLTKDAHGEQAAQLADRILARMQQTVGSLELRNLGSALPALAKETHGEHAAQLAVRILERMQQTTDLEKLSDLGNALVAVTLPDQLEKLADSPIEIDCSAAVANTSRQNLGLLVDMLKWPTCSSRDGVMIRIAELEGVTDLSSLGSFDDPLNRATFRADVRKFLSWLHSQKDAQGRPFNLDSPPAHHPSLPVR